MTFGFMLARLFGAIAPKIAGGLISGLGFKEIWDIAIGILGEEPKPGSAEEQTLAQCVWAALHMSTEIGPEGWKLESRSGEDLDPGVVHLHLKGPHKGKLFVTSKYISGKTVRAANNRGYRRGVQRGEGKELKRAAAYTQG